MSILARWTHLKIYCTLMPACRAWLSLHPIFSAYPILGAHLLTTYTYKRMHLLNRVYGALKVSDYSDWPLSYSHCCCCHSNKTWFIITFVLYSRCKWHNVQCSLFLITRDSVCNSLQFFQWLVVLQYSGQSYGYIVSQMIVSETVVGYNRTQTHHNKFQVSVAMAITPHHQSSHWYWYGLHLTFYWP